ncbi:group XIIB secretory phospholipase A2-like protein isoform X2 [Leptonychotes weddellii]|uniref:Group XIIB secretory phospholipase A2-like protein n=1 Tax=Leptonychotes weddellii TaxID=9713 RepID=A0A7F8QLF7_LEPWE|nr:group XIIB secretory phospholipase A2-like protein isoform X2 [Leptonychotes weddellii]
MSIRRQFRQRVKQPPQPRRDCLPNAVHTFPPALSVSDGRQCVPSSREGSPLCHCLTQQWQACRGREGLQPAVSAHRGSGPEQASHCPSGLMSEVQLRTGKAPMPRPGYKPQEPNGCSSYFLGLKVPESMDLGIPAMTKCCNQLDVCYDTCGANKYRCDAKFRWCLHSICSDLKRSLGFVSNVEACDSLADTVFNTVWTLGCRPFMNSQRAACICAEEEKAEL